MPTKTIVHLLRHGEVHNPDGVLYGRLPGFHLSDRGRQMADRVAETLRDHDLTHLRCSPLERAQETMRPQLEFHDLPVITDGRVIEAENYLEGSVVSFGASSILKNKRNAMRSPRNWLLFRNPLRPTWGERYPEIVERMRLAIRDAAEAAEGHEALIVSHQLPIWMARSDIEGRRLAHDPRKRECTLASLTSITIIDGRVAGVKYTEPAKDLLPAKRSEKFVAGA
ncbi:histidine phosphatase family protein [Microlunatus sp. GCM10028923]|uniref:histidine phosphatase family protein n=1 Tax=Microlunatus sp. GCM10028923 TaxID=3273400 RepID=UPI00360E8E42